MKIKVYTDSCKRIVCEEKWFLSSKRKAFGWQGLGCLVGKKSIVFEVDAGKKVDVQVVAKMPNCPIWDWVDNSGDIHHCVILFSAAAYVHKYSNPSAEDINIIHNEFISSFSHILS